MRVLLLLLSTTIAFCAYNETAAKMMLNLAAGAYGNDSMRQACVLRTFASNEIQEIVSSFTVDCDTLANTCSGYIVASQPLQQVTVVFQGTKTDSQLLLEGWTTINPQEPFYNMGNANTYFVRGLERLWPSVEAVLNNTLYTNYHVYFTGHSLGAAMANLAAAKTVQLGLRQGSQVSLLNFGQPRVGNIEYSNNFDNIITDSYRVISEADIVPHIPACAKMDNTTNSAGSHPCDPGNTQKAYHTGTEVWYPVSSNLGSNYTICTGWPKDEDFSCSDSQTWNLGDTSSAIFMHRHYFGVEVPDFGENGCDPSMPNGTAKQQKSGTFDKVASAVSKVGGWFSN